MYDFSKVIFLHYAILGRLEDRLLGHWFIDMVLLSVTSEVLLVSVSVKIHEAKQAHNFTNTWLSLKQNANFL